jgi:hypothetical protein
LAIGSFGLARFAEVHYAVAKETILEGECGCHNDIWFRARSRIDPGKQKWSHYDANCKSRASNGSNQFVTVACC